jgi:hypothetical protein
MKILTTPRPLGTATRWRVASVRHDEEEEEGIALVQLFTTGLMLISERYVKIRNGQCDRVSIDLAP